MQTLQMSPTVITGWATVGQYLEGEGSESGNYRIKRKQSRHAQACKDGKTGACKST